MRALNLTGQRFAKLVALRKSASVRAKLAWVCQCDCGTQVTVLVDSLRSGNTKSCGCAKLAALMTRCLKHGNARAGAKTCEYSIWKTMKDRCSRRASPRYKDYGGRGIAVCKRWRESFGAFLADMGPRPSSAHSIDRIDNDGNYEPSNCRWATATEQANNKRRRAA